MIVIRLIKRIMVVVPILSLAVAGVLVALLLWMLFGAGASEFGFPYEIWIGRMMDWAER